MNSALAIGSLLIPQEALALVLVSAGIALIVGARRLAGTLVAITLAMAVLPPFIEPLFEALPAWMLLLMLVAIGLALLRAIASLLLGRNAADTMVGNLAAALILARV